MSSCTEQYRSNWTWQVLLWFKTWLQLEYQHEWYLLHELGRFSLLRVGSDGGTTAWLVDGKCWLCFSPALLHTNVTLLSPRSRRISNVSSQLYTTQPTGSELTSGQILGTQPLADTTSVVPIWSSGQTSLQWLHILAAIFALLNVLSLFVPPRWINGGKGKLADFQRSGILTLVLSVISMIFTIVAFACVFTIVLNGKSALNAIEGISAKWPSSAAFWVSFFHSFHTYLHPFSFHLYSILLLYFPLTSSSNLLQIDFYWLSICFDQFVLPSFILFIPALLVVLMPVYGAHKFYSTACSIRIGAWLTPSLVRLFLSIYIVKPDNEDEDVNYPGKADLPFRIMGRTVSLTFNLPILLSLNQTILHSSISLTHRKGNLSDTSHADLRIINAWKIRGS